MAKVLGYQRLQQTDIDKYYSPQSHHDASELATQIQLQLLRVLKGTGHLVVPHEIINAAAPPPVINPDPNAGKAALPPGGGT